MKWLWQVAATALLVVAASLPGGAQVPSPPPFVPNEIIVKYKAGFGEAERSRARSTVRAIRRRTIHVARRVELLHTTRPLADAIAELRAAPEIEFAEPNWIVQHAAVSNDPRFLDGSLWGMYADASTPANSFGSQAAELWQKGHTGSSSVYVGVVDEGIDFNHPDLAANIWTNPFDPADGVDNDGNGKIDDIHGWDFFEDNNSIYDGTPTDRQLDAHGTHVAGTIGAVGGNGVGVAGVNWNVTMISAKFLGPADGTTADAIAATEYLTDLKIRHGLNLVAVNHSWGGGGYSLGLHQALIRAAKNEILSIVAAGNSNINNDVSPQYPAGYATDISAGSESAASYDGVIAVASITSTGAKSSFSNYGATTVDLGAPGSSILSTTPQNTYSTFSGTSMAAPHVTGAAAAYRAIHGSASAAEMRSAILGRGISTPSLNGITVTGRRLNVAEFDDSLPSLTINNVTVPEGDSAAQPATFTVTLAAKSSSDVTVSFVTEDVNAWSATRRNESAIAIPSAGSAGLYPSTIEVPTGLGIITEAAVTLDRFSHTFPRDVDVLLVGPGGQSVVLMSDVGGSIDATGLTLTFDDDGPSLPSGGALTSGTFKPTNIDDGEGADAYAGPAPAPPYDSALSIFDGTNPAGTWRLFAMDDTLLDAGTIVRGWSLTLTTTVPTDYAFSSGILIIPAGADDGTIAVSINGDTVIEGSETFRVRLSSALGATLDDDQGIGTISNDDLSAFTDAPFTAGATVVRAIHIDELRTRINGLRLLQGLAAFGWTDSSLASGGTNIMAVHVSELRTALSQAYVAAGLPAPAFTDPALPGVLVRALHFSELQSAVMALESQ
jgi:subtilisin-like proprotein convertase family protein